MYQHRQRNIILISKITSVACRVSIFIKFVKLAELDDCFKNVLFRPIFISVNTCILTYKNKELGYTADRESIFSILKLVYGNLNIDLQSLRSGGGGGGGHSCS